MINKTMLFASILSSAAFLSTSAIAADMTSTDKTIEVQKPATSAVVSGEAGAAPQIAPGAGYSATTKAPQVNAPSSSSAPAGAATGVGNH